ncbi:hypothetical protein [Pseudomonas sp. MWU13-2105]|uniref:hypothetical protein n=1 Tax=Pseudomonas sp. MWU13-2105 TaxID=2935074 RepID=UPI00399C4802
MIDLDGAMGGGQVLRSGLSLSMVTGRFTTPGMTEHLYSNIRVIESFLPLRITCTTAADGVLHVECRA